MLPIANEIEHEQAVVIPGDCLTIEHARARRQGSDRFGYERKMIREVEAVAGYEADAIVVAVGYNASCLIS